MSLAAYRDLEHDEVRPEPGDGRRLAVAALCLAIAGIIVPVVLSVAALITAARAKRIMGDAEGFDQHRSLASNAQTLACIDLMGQVMFVTIFITVFA